MKKSILLLTDLNNGETEDLITADYLKKYFNVAISYFKDISKVEEDFDIILKRNTWPSSYSNLENYYKLESNFFKRVKKKNLKIYNDLYANCDRDGKDYLIKLFKNSFPVIPSIDSIKDLNLLPKVDQYLIKPKNGFSSLGIKTISRDSLFKINLDNQLIQPKIKFKYEISFYFIDKKFLYCLIFEPSKIPAWPKPKEYTPNRKELLFAKQFVNWNKMRYGICRIDALMTHEGELLLLEIEDDSPYFSITEIDEKLKKLFLRRLKNSIKKVIS